MVLFVSCDTSIGPQGTMGAAG